MVAITRVEASAHAPAQRFSIMPILNRKKKRCEEIKVIMLGDAGVGKTSLVAALAQRSSQHDSTGVDFHVKMATVSDEIVKMQLWDTADQEKFGIHALPKSYFRRARGVFLMYDVVDRKSFQNVVEWAAHLQALTADTEPVGVVLVANQSHTAAVAPPDVVSSSEGRALAAVLHCRFVAYTSLDSAEACFEALIHQLSDTTNWEPSLSDIAARLAAIEADVETEKDLAATSETESEDEEPQDLETERPVGPQSFYPVSMCGSSETRSLVIPQIANHRRTSRFFTALELGLAGSKDTRLAWLPTAHDLLRAMLLFICVVLFACPFTLLLLLRDDPQMHQRNTEFAGLVVQWLRSFSTQ